jgi:hypothetical protein
VSAEPTAEQLVAKGLTEIPASDFAEASTNGWPLREYNASAQDFPPVGA